MGEMLALYKSKHQQWLGFSQYGHHAFTEFERNFYGLDKS